MSRARRVPAALPRAPWRTALLGVALALGGCASEQARLAVRDVLTLRTGTVSELRDRRGRGPLREHAVPPEAMLELAAQACRGMVGLRGRPVTTVEVSRRYGEVTAKEQGLDGRRDPAYGDEWVSAVVITVHPVPGDPARSRVEWHACRRSMLMGCGVDWAGLLDARLDAAVAAWQAQDPRAPGLAPSAR